MSHPGLVESLQRRLQTHRQNLELLLEQQAIHTVAFVPPVVVSSIREARREIRVIKAQLEQLGAPAADLLNDHEQSAPTAPVHTDGPAPALTSAELLSADERAALADVLLDMLFATHTSLDLLLSELPLRARASVRWTGVMQADVLALLDQFAARRMLLSDGSHPLERVLGRAAALAAGLGLEQGLKDFRTLVRQRLGQP